MGNSVQRVTGLLLALGLTACGGGGSGPDEGPLNVDYSALRVAESQESPLRYASSNEQIFRPLRNGLRLMMGTGFAVTPGLAGVGELLLAPDTSRSHSGTTVQMEGVDEADSVKYDGRHIFATRPEIVPASPTAPQWSRNVLSIARTDAVAGTVQPVSTYVIEGEQSARPLLYQLSGVDGVAEQLVAVSHNFRGWFSTVLPVEALVVQPDRTTVQVLDVRDPQHVTQTWKLEMDGWISASRMIGDTLYLVSSYRPRVPDLIFPADTLEKRESNERRIRSSSMQELLPQYSIDGGARRPLTNADGCLIAQQMDPNEGYTDLLVISAINVRTRRVTDVNCLSTNINGVYMSAASLYVAGTSARGVAPATVLHKFAIHDGQVTYRATGAVTGKVGWSNPSYFMDEHDGDLRILTSTGNVHQLTVMRESWGQRLMIVSSLPNPARTAPIGKPGESVYAVRFMGARGYVVTFRRTDPLYVLDLRNPTDPAIAGELEVPGFSTYLRPLGPTQSEFLLAVGQESSPEGLRGGIKVELFDVRDMAHPQVVGSKSFGSRGTRSEALDNPHAIAFLQKPAPGANLRLALPIDVYDTPSGPDSFDWTYSGLHMLEVSGSDTAAPQLQFRGVLQTGQRSPSTRYPSYESPNRAVLHGDSAFGVHGARFLSSLWQDLQPPAQQVHSGGP